MQNQPINSLAILSTNFWRLPLPVDARDRIARHQAFRAASGGAGCSVPADRF
jgi:hypothetical protein